MYTRDPNNKNQPPMRPPNNYGGTAFRDGEPRLPVDIPSPPVIVRPANEPTARGGEKIPQIRERTNIHSGSSPHTSFSPNGALLARTSADIPPTREETVKPPTREEIANPSPPPPDIAAPAGLVFPDNLAGPRAGGCEEGCPSPDDGGCQPSSRPANPLLSLFSSLMPPGFGKHGQEFGYEELLIVGLIFLLSQSEGESDILLLLALLLFF